MGRNVRHRQQYSVLNGIVANLENVMHRIGSALTGNVNDALNARGDDMGMAKVFVAFTLIGILEVIANFKDKSEKRSFELSMAILMAAWILRDGW